MMARSLCGGLFLVVLVAADGEVHTPSDVMVDCDGGAQSCDAAERSAAPRDELHHLGLLQKELRLQMSAAPAVAPVVAQAVAPVASQAVAPAVALVGTADAAAPVVAQLPVKVTTPSHTVDLGKVDLSTQTVAQLISLGERSTKVHRASAAALMLARLDNNWSFYLVLAGAIGLFVMIFWLCGAATEYNDEQDSERDYKVPDASSGSRKFQEAEGNY